MTYQAIDRVFLMYDSGFPYVPHFFTITSSSRIISRDVVTLLNFEGVLCIYVLLLNEGQAEYHFAMFSICLKQTIDFQCIIIYDLLFVLLFML
jgi:hypothetical protein